MSPKNKALLASFGRVFAAAALAAYLNVGKAPLDLRLDDLKGLVNAGIGAALLTLVNYLRSGETRFGRKSEDSGMGTDDPVQAGGKVAVKTPEGDVVQVKLEEAANAAGPAPVDEDGAPEQTDNGPQPGDKVKTPRTTFSGEMR